MGGEAPDLDRLAVDAPAARAHEAEARPGANTIELSGPSGFAPDLDRLLVQPA